MEAKHVFLFLAFLASISFGAAPAQPSDAWYMTSGLAVLVSAIVLAGIYAVGIAFESNEMKFLASEELYQLLATIVMISAFSGAVVFFNGVSTDVGAEFGSPSSLQALASSIVSSNQGNASAMNLAIVEIANHIGDESSKSAFCSLQGVAINLAGCGGFRADLSPLSLGANAIAVSLAELQSLGFLLDVGTGAAIAILLPAGIFLRTFKMTRPAGGLLIALGVSLYLVLPLGIVAMNSVSERFLSENIPGVVVTGGGATSPVSYGDKYGMEVVDSGKSAATGYACYPWNIKDESFVLSFSFTNAHDGTGNNVEAARNLFDDLKGMMDAVIYQIFIRFTLTTVISVLMAVLAIRYMASLAGAEVDVTSLAKIA